MDKFNIKIAVDQCNIYIITISSISNNNNIKILTVSKYWMNKKFILILVLFLNFKLIKEKIQKKIIFISNINITNKSFE